MAIPEPPRVLRVAADLDWSITDRLRIVHVGQSGIVLASSAVTSDELLPVTFGARGLVPGGVHLPDAADVRRLVAHLGSARPSRAIDIGPGPDTVSLSSWPSTARPIRVDLSLRTRSIDPTAVSEIARLLRRWPGPTPASPAMDPGRQRTAAWRIAKAVVLGDRDPAPMVGRLIGSGPGSTPAGDDVLIGLLAAFGVARRADLLDPVAVRGCARLRARVADSLGRTTAASRHDLRSALRDTFCERVHELLAQVATAQTDSAALVTRAATWGGTSGLDLLHGVVAGAAAALAAHDRSMPGAA